MKRMEARLNRALAADVSRRQQTSADVDVCCGMKRMEAPSQSGTGSRLFVLVLFFLLFEEEKCVLPLESVCACA